MNALRLGLAQIDPVVGDFAHNAALIAGVFARLAAQGAELVLTPELALSGYPPEDLLLRPDFYRAARRHLESLAALTTEEGPALLVGVPWADEGGRFNAAALLRGGRIDGSIASVCCRTTPSSTRNVTSALAMSPSSSPTAAFGWGW